VANTIDFDLVTMALRDFMSKSGDDSWKGTSTELYEELTDSIPENKRKSKLWPQAPNWLRNRLTRAAAALRSCGIEVDDNTRRAGKRGIAITYNPDNDINIRRIDANCDISENSVIGKSLKNRDNVGNDGNDAIKRTMFTGGPRRFKKSG
jgi:hypothetical protein